MEEQTNSVEKKDSKLKKLLKKMPVKVKMILALVLVAVLAIAVIWVGSVISNLKNEDVEPEIDVSTTLEKMVKTNDLSTFEAVYNGIAEVKNEKKPEKIDCYVAYEAKVKAGIDVQKVEITLNEEEKTISVKLPKVVITDTEVDIGSLDYIFENKKINKEGIAAVAYKASIDDVNNEAKTKDAILELAKGNAQNIIKALISPFAAQYDSTYKIVFI